jgi:hypothetical protein
MTTPLITWPPAEVRAAAHQFEGTIGGRCAGMVWHWDGWHRDPEPWAAMPAGVRDVTSDSCFDDLNEFVKWPKRFPTQEEAMAAIEALWVQRLERAKEPETWYLCAWEPLSRAPRVPWKLMPQEG